MQEHQSCGLKNFQSKNLSRYSEEYQVVQGLWWQKGKRLHIIHENNERSRFCPPVHTYRLVDLSPAPSFCAHRHAYQFHRCFLAWTRSGWQCAPTSDTNRRGRGLGWICLLAPFSKAEGLTIPKWTCRKRSCASCAKPIVIGVPAPSENDQRDLDHPQGMTNQ